jgi:soluble lytic murein transglycosylase
MIAQTRRTLTAALLVVLFGAAPSGPASAASTGALPADLFLHAADAKIAQTAFQAAAAGQWAKAELTARESKDPMLLKLVHWLGLVREGVPVPFFGVARFYEENHHWPMQTQLRRRVEESIGPDVPPAAVIDWFHRHPPGSAIGRIRYAEALIATGAVERGKALIRDAWITGSFPKAQEKAILKRHGKFLSKDDHAQRLDRVLWDGKVEEARRLMWRVDPGHRALAEARLMLRHRQGNVDRLVARVPAELQRDPGLLYERARWRRVKGKYQEAREIFDDPPKDLERADLWWQERAILARRGVREGLVGDAYRLVKAHGLSPAQSAPYADAEWLAGWIALRFLQDPKTALEHFKAMHGAVVYPVSKARGAYWIGRAAEAMSDMREAETWYRAAATQSTVFYGQLAAAKLGSHSRLKLPVEPEPTSGEAQDFKAHELVRAARVLHALGYKDEVRPFVLQVAEVKDTPGWRRMAANLARALQREEVAIQVAKRASRGGVELSDSGYPTMRLPRLPADGKGRALPESPLIFAVVRQESAFQVDAVSSAGARGLMQLMPKTASDTARALNISHNPARLSDPDYNLRLGQAYLRDMIAEFGGSYVLALAAYNAGPKRAREWLKAHGDPRAGVEQAVDWIEMIPFEETRNYVQRVLENLQVYRLKGNGGSHEAQLAERDLKR